MTDEALLSAAMPDCPACGSPLPQAQGSGPLGCPGCGRLLPVAALRELQQLRSLGEWTQLRASWLADRLTAGDLPDRGWSALDGSASAAAPAVGAVVPGAAGPRPAQRPAPGAVPGTRASTAGADGLLLAGGAVLLVLAGIAFVAFAWDLLGPAGQVLTLYALGAAAMVSGWRLRTRLPGTAATLGVVGALLVGVSTIATRMLGPDLIGEAASLLVSVFAAALLATAGALVVAHWRGVGEVAASVGAALVLGLAALAPIDDAIWVGDRYAWWAGGVVLLGAVVLLVLGHRLSIVSWGALSVVAFLIGSVVWAVYAADELRVADADSQLIWFGAAATLAGLGALQLALIRVLAWRPVAPAFSAGPLTAVAGTAAVVAGVADPASRPLAAVTLGLLLGVLQLAGAVLRGRLVATVVRLLSFAAAGGIVGFGVTPWTESWAGWRGPVAGVVIALLLVAVAEIDRSGQPLPRGGSALVAAGAAVGCWLAAVTGDLAWAAGESQLGVAAGLAVVAVVGWLEPLHGKLPDWTVWLAGGLGAMAVLATLDARPPSATWAPEVYGAALAAVAAVSGALYWFLHRQASTWLSMGPAVTAALAPTTLAVLDDATGRWWGADTPGTSYQVRVASLLVVGSLLVVLGIWQRWAGALVPAAIAVLAVTVIQLIELGRFLPQFVSFAVAGGVLVAAGARWESVRRLGRAGGAWARDLR